MVNLDADFIAGIYFADLRGENIGKGFVGKLTRRGLQAVKNDKRYVPRRNYAEVMNRAARMYRGCNFSYSAAEGGDLRFLGNYRVEVYYEVYVILCEKIPLYCVDGVVAFNNIFFSRHFHMDAGEAARWTVIVDYEVMGAQDERI